MSAIGKLLILKLDGTCEKGFRVMAELREEGNHTDMEDDGHLPPAPELISTLNQWQSTYRKLGGSLRGIRPESIVYEGSIHHVSNTLVRQFNQWLSCEGLTKLNLNLRRKLNSQDAIRIIIRTTDQQVHRLPWHQWTLIEEYRHAEIGFSPFRFEKPHRLPKHQTELIRILAILGNQAGIDTSKDRHALESLSNAKVKFLFEPTRQELNEQLWNSAWDILFFAGHSQTEFVKGRIFINKEDSLTLDDLKYGLKRAIEHGLQLAIFNSCDGLGLAYELEQLHMPQMIVMREPVPDLVAQEFLKAFLIEFSSGSSLYLAERTAREQLQGLEDQYPCASWLPAIYQNPTILPVSWKSLRNASKPSPFLLSWWQRWRVLLLGTFVIISLIIGLRSQGFLQTSELKAYDLLVQLRPKAPADDRILIITVDEEDIAYQDKHNLERKKGWSLSDQALTQVLQIIIPHQPRVVGLDIYHPYVFAPNLYNLVQAQLPFVSICQMDLSDGIVDTMIPPPNLFEEQIGFSDLAIDPDKVIRRQLVSMAKGEICQTSHAFGLQIVEQYLEFEGIEPIQRLKNGDQKLGKSILRRFQYNSGGYQLSPKEAKEANGYQTLLNYRRLPPQRIALRDLLTNKNLLESMSLKQEFIVLIGVDQAGQDQHLTPLQSKPIPGVEIHSYIISQLLDAALEGKGIVWWLPKWQESVWISFWALLAGICTIRAKSNIYIGLGILAIISSLFVSCWLLLLVDGWVPLIPAFVSISGMFIATIITCHNRVSQEHNP